MADPSPFGVGELLRVAVARTRFEHAPERQSGPLTATLVVSLAVERALDVVVAGVAVALALAPRLLPTVRFTADSYPSRCSRSTRP
jgi:hypothetical protein